MGMEGPVDVRADQSTLQPVVICGPSGVGKGTLIAKLMHDFPDRFGFSVSHTTRSARAKEQDGVHYHFAARSVMARDIQEGRFLESAEVHGNLYGTSWAAVEAVADAGKICILDIDVQGAQAVKKSALQARYIFVKPPAPEEQELEKRLRGRGTETEEQLQKRLRNARQELERAKDATLFDHILVNENLDEAYEKLKGLLGLSRPAARPAHAGNGTAKHLAHAALESHTANGSAVPLNGCLPSEHGGFAPHAHGCASDHSTHANGFPGSVRQNGVSNAAMKLSKGLPLSYNHTLAILTPSDLLIGMHAAAGSPRANRVSAS